MKRNASAQPNGSPPLMRAKEISMQMSVQNAVNLLESLGYTVAKPRANEKKEPEPQPRGRSYRISEVALAWRVCDRTVYRMIATGKLAAIKVGNMYRVPEEAMLLYERLNKCR